VDPEYLYALKKQELDNVITKFGDCFTGKDLLEIGSGTGYQLSLLAKRCKSVTGIDLPTSIYTSDRVAKITDYDGVFIPFADSSFDVLFSSNTLEHVQNISAFHQEMHRVLRKDGIAIHIVPTHIWRIWTILVHYPALPGTIIRALLRKPVSMKSLRTGASDTEFRGHSKRSIWRVIAQVLFPSRHGEMGNSLSEMMHLRPKRWVQGFTENEWIVMDSAPTGLFHTGYCLFGLGISIQRRETLAEVLGSACFMFMLSKKLNPAA
jgi:SAM-dependent methyltransferase